MAKLKSLFGSVIRPPDKPSYTEKKKGVVKPKELGRQGIKPKKKSGGIIKLKGKK